MTPRAPEREPAGGPPTKLRAVLAGGGQVARAGPLEAFKLARRRWQAAERVDMSGLAAELGVNRVTLYRWVGSREQLLVEVIWSLARATLERVDAEVKATGGERIVQIATRFLDAVITNRGMRHWLREEGESAMRLLTRYATGFQPRLVDWIEALLREETEAGRLDLPADLHEVAYVIEQLIESYVYLDLITGEEPDARRAEPILRMLLR
ncbi:MAG: TetR/AcrR family transcriptional regulator [Solirubrobacterales bacterium]|nr:TetR/AcrR family transcriptional regulator [Solirubrobacterales bacterium]